MLYATIFHLLAGVVTGSVFKIRTLLLLLVLVLAESVILAFVHGNISGLWVVANLAGLQLGYVAGMYGRGVLEHAGHALSNVRTRRLP